LNETKTWILAASAAALAFVFLTEQVQATRLGYELGSARSAIKARRDRVAYLRLELDRLHAPQRLASLAQSRLGMTPPMPESLIVLGNTVDRPLRVAELPKPEKGFTLSRLID